MYDKEPKCSQCIPDLMAGNETVLDVYLLVSNQHIMGFSGPVDLNFQSVEFVLNILKVENKEKVFKRVYNLYKKLLKKQYDELEEKRKLGIK